MGKSSGLRCCWPLVFGMVYADEEQKTVFGDVLIAANVSVDGSITYNSKYIWRGFKLDDDPVLQPSITFNAFNGWAVNVWSNFDVGQEDELNSDDIDTVVTYSHTFENLSVSVVQLNPLTITVGHTYYDF